ncbi:MAG: hypothetical protein M3Y87_17590 [Myxococcota bacterium]|nr:hypothetical protein [Myxococcota bacterium]
MRSSSFVLVFTIVSMLTACGSAAPEPQSGADDASDSCAGYRRTDACITDENFAQCRAREEECPGQVLALESCPLQFACP